MSTIEALFSEGSPLAQALPGFTPRPAQRRMAVAVAEALSRHGHLMVEAGTGTGKTFAYLVPAMLSGGRLIVSTGTRTLQDQLFARDVPLLAGALGRGTRIALLKGRANYLCRERLLRPQVMLPLGGAAERQLADTLAQWAGFTQTGDLAEVPALAEGHPLRARLTSTRDNCSGSRCAEFARCHVFAARRRAAEADLVVVNHHLLLADLALKEEGYGDLLPAADAVILDEAHQLPDLATQFFGTQCGSRQVETLLADLPAALVAEGHDARRCHEAAAAVQPTLRSLVALVQARTGVPGRAAWETRDAELDALADTLGTSLAALASQLEALQGGETLQQLAGRTARLAEDLADMIVADPGSGARVIESTARNVTLQWLPFDAGERFRALALARRCAWIFTSATLTVNGDFSHFSRRMGLEDDTERLAIDSPFDYARQALLLLPPGLPDPGDPRHGPAVVDLARQLLLVSRGGAFLLFTSLRALERAAALLRAEPLEGRTLYVQGEAPREQLLRAFREDGRGVLLGSASFWEGVDVKGEALHLVVIDKLPFAAPDDPLTRARLEHIRAGGGSPFTGHQLPEAALVLKQGVGRLIRSETDRGVVVLCDPRLTTRGYGRSLLDGLPPMRRSRDVAEACRFLAQCVAEGP
ncbi:MAG: hypothetical protein RL026_221 [Pseudomonadota bacterium]